MIHNDESPSTRWNRTSRVLERVRWQLTHGFVPDYGTAEFFKGHHVIGRDRPIRNGVYLGAFSREAIVVADDPSMLRAYDDLRKRLSRLAWLYEERTIRTVHDFVRERIPGGTVAETEALIAQLFPGGANDRKIALSVFLESGTGVCRHRPLLAAYLVEKLIRDRILFGRVSMDRAEDDLGGHAWMRFTSRWSKRIFVSDSALGPCGELFSIREDWSYLRPEDTPPKPKSSAPSLHDEIDYAVAAGGLLWLAWRFLS